MKKWFNMFGFFCLVKKMPKVSHFFSFKIKYNCDTIHALSWPLVLSRVTEVLEPIPGVTGWHVGYTLDRADIQTQNHSHSHSRTYSVSKKMYKTKAAMLGFCWNCVITVEAVVLCCCFRTRGSQKCSFLFVCLSCAINCGNLRLRLHHDETTEVKSASWG